MKWSEREEMVLGKSLDALVALVNMYKNRYGCVLILVFMFEGCVVRDSWMIGWVLYHQKAKSRYGNWIELLACIQLFVQLRLSYTYSS
jgi:hypothetical protein